jgi:hypothetical protein
MWASASRQASPSGAVSQAAKGDTGLTSRPPTAERSSSQFADVGQFGSPGRTRDRRRAGADFVIPNAAIGHGAPVNSDMLTAVLIRFRRFTSCPQLGRAIAHVGQLGELSLAALFKWDQRDPAADERLQCAAMRYPVTALVAALFLAPLRVEPSPKAPTVPLSRPLHRVVFEFHSAFLMNLHAFLLDAATRKRELSSYRWVVAPSEADSQVLTDAIAFYRANYAKRDPLFDETMAGIKRSLSIDDDRRDTAGLNLPQHLAAILERVAPIYAQCIWPDQDKSNQDWIRAVKALNAKFGADVQANIEHLLDHAFQRTPIREDIVVQTGSYNGGYTDTQTILPSGRSDYQGLASLEMLYHEAVHVDVADTVTDAIEAQLKAAHRADNDLWHAVQFYTVGEVVKRSFKRIGQRDYETYADKNGVYTRGQWPLYHAVIESDWVPYMRGHSTLRQAVRGMVSKLPAPLG